MKKKNFDWNKFNNTALKSLAFVALLYGFIQFSTGVHNIDNAWNLRNINDMILQKEIQVVETTALGTEIDAIETYRMGVLQTLSGFVISVFSAFFLALQFENINVGKNARRKKN